MMRGGARGVGRTAPRRRLKTTDYKRHRPPVTHRIVRAGFKPVRTTNLRHQTTVVFTNGQGADRLKAKPEG